MRVGRFWGVAILCAVLSVGAETRDGPTVVLSGGGARGLAQIGVLRALEEAGIRPSLLVGNSMGAIVASLYAAGYSADELTALAKKVDWDAFFRNSARRADIYVSQKSEPIDYLLELRFDRNLAPLLPNSISHGQAFYDLLTPLLGPAQFRCGMVFDSLPIPLRVVATDLVSGTPVIIDRGDLVRAVRASSGVPLAFSPVVIDSMLLVDGGLTSNIPVQAALSQGGEFIIACDLTSPMWTREQLTSPVRIADQIVNIGITQHKEAERELADFVIRPDVSGFVSTDFSDAAAIIDRGYAEGKAVMDDLLVAMGRTKQQAPADQPLSHSLSFRWLDTDTALGTRIEKALSDTCPCATTAELRNCLESALDSLGYDFGRLHKIVHVDSQWLIGIDPGIIRRIRIQGNRRTSPQLIRLLTGLNEGDTLTSSALERAQGALYSTGLFKTVGAQFHQNGTIVFHLNEQEYIRTRMAARFDEFHFLEGYIAPAFENLFGLGMCASFHLQYGLRREKYALDLLSTQPFGRFLASIIRFQTYISRERIREERQVFRVDTITQEPVPTDEFFLQEMTLRKAGVNMLIGTEVGKSAMLEFGARIEQFRVDRSVGSVFQDPLSSFENGVRLLVMRFYLDNTDQFPFPQKGHRDYFSVAGAPYALGGTERFLRVDGSLSSFYTFRARHTLYPTLQFSWSDDTLPDVERMFLGGALPQEKFQDMGIFNYLSFMGLPSRAWPGDVVFLAKMNYRFLLRRDLHLNATIDWGYAWMHGEFFPRRVITRNELRNMPVGMGIGVAFNSFLGPIRFTWGRLLYSGNIEERLGVSRNRNQFYFSAGHDF